MLEGDGQGLRADRMRQADDALVSDGGALSEDCAFMVVIGIKDAELRHSLSERDILLKHHDVYLALFR